MVTKIRSELKKGKVVAIRAVIGLSLLMPLVFGPIFITPGEPEETKTMAGLVTIIVLVAGYQILAVTEVLLTQIVLTEDLLMVKTGWGRKKQYPLSSIDGYKKYFVPANRRLHPVIIVFSGGKKAAEISGSFTKNIDE